MSAICIAALILMLRFPVVTQTRPFAELLVRILVEEVESVVQPTDVDDVPVVPDAPLEEIQPAPAEGGAQTAAGEAATFHDWYAEIPEAVSAALDNVPKEYSVNPVFDEKRRRAAEQFRPSKAVVAKPIWENVEKDTLGRSILWSGDCFRVIDDPNVGSREAFETFGQHIVSCLYRKEVPKELPWVNEIRNRQAGQARYGHPAAE